MRFLKLKLFYYNYQFVYAPSHHITPTALDHYVLSHWLLELCTLYEGSCKMIIGLSQRERYTPLGANICGVKFPVGLKNEPHHRTVLVSSRFSWQHYSRQGCCAVIYRDIRLLTQHFNFQCSESWRECRITDTFMRESLRDQRLPRGPHFGSL